MNLADQNQKPNEQLPGEGRVLDKLEEMWDKQILKGDDEFYESRIPNKSKQIRKHSEGKVEPTMRSRRRSI